MLLLLSLYMMMKDKCLQIILVDDSLPFLDALELHLKKSFNCNLLAKYVNGEELINSPLLHKADLVFCDIEMPVMNGILATKIVNRKLPQLPIIAITMHEERIYLKEIIEAGFKGFIYKPKVYQNLIETVEKVMANELAIPNNLNNQ